MRQFATAALTLYAATRNTQVDGQVLSFYKTLGTTSADYGYDIKIASDGTAFVVGYTEGYGGDNEVFITKYDTSENIEWSEVLVGPSLGRTHDYGQALALTSDSGAVFTGYSNGFVAGNDYEAFMGKVNTTGGTEWLKALGDSSKDDYGYGIVVASDGSVFMAGATKGYSAPTGKYDVLLVKSSGTGVLDWIRTLSGGNHEYARGITVVSDGGVVLTGGTRTYGGTAYNVLLSKFDAAGTHQWTKTLSGNSQEVGYDVMEATDGSLYITGYTKSVGAGKNDILVAKYDASGNLVWAFAIGGSKDDIGYRVVEANDGGILVVGSYYDAVTYGYSAIVLKFNPLGVLQWGKLLTGSNVENGFGIDVKGNGDILVTGDTTSYGEGSNEMLFALLDGDGGADCGVSVTPTVTNVTLSLTEANESPTINSPVDTFVNVTAPVSVQSPVEGTVCLETLSPTASPTAATTQPSQSPTSSPTAATVQPSLSPSTSPTAATAQPSLSPTTSPTAATAQPSLSPTTSPTAATAQPSLSPTGSPSQSPSQSPSASPTAATAQPSLSPSISPTLQPSKSPSISPTASTTQPSLSPSASPTASTSQPSQTPTGSPSSQPSQTPTASPTFEPSQSPTPLPSLQPSKSPSGSPTNSPTASTTQPSQSPTTSQPTQLPTNSPTASTAQPSQTPTGSPSSQPSQTPTASPTFEPSQLPTESPTNSPTQRPTTAQPSQSPTHLPTSQPTGTPTTSQPSQPPTSSPTASTAQPSVPPTGLPTLRPSQSPTELPTFQPTQTPTDAPTLQPSYSPTDTPTFQPTQTPTDAPTLQPSYSPTDTPTFMPTQTPSDSPTQQPSLSPTEMPTFEPTMEPTFEPTAEPTMEPTALPTAIRSTPSPARIVVRSPTLVVTTESPKSAGAKTPGEAFADAFQVDKEIGWFLFGLSLAFGGGVIAAVTYFGRKWYKNGKAKNGAQEQVPNEDLDEEEHLEMQITNGNIYMNEKSGMTLYTIVSTEQ